MRHLREKIVQSMQEEEQQRQDENTPPTRRRFKNKKTSTPDTDKAEAKNETKNNVAVADIDQLIDSVEKRIHFNKKKQNDDPLGLLNPPDPEPTNTVEQKKKLWLRARLMLKNTTQRGKQIPTPAAHGDERRKSTFGALETLEEEARGDVDDQASPVDDGMRQDHDHDDDGTNATATDSIIEMRMANSEDYVASVCSLRSLNTFEKDYLTNIIAEQGEMDEVSVSTFEKDFLAKQAAGVATVLPMQVLVNNSQQGGDNWDNDTMLSETTFEQDARSILTPKDQAARMGMAGASHAPPTQVVSVGNGMVDDDDELTVGTLENIDQLQQQQQQQRQVMTTGSAPTAVAVFDSMTATFRNTMSAETGIVSVSTYEKDAAAINALALKIGRHPSTALKSVTPDDGLVLNDDASDNSTSTFEQDQIAKQDAILLAQAKAASYGVIVQKNQSDNSENTFEQDYGVRGKKQPMSPINEQVKTGLSAKSGGLTLSTQPQPMMVQQQQYNLPVSPMSEAPTPVGSPINSPPWASAFENDANSYVGVVNHNNPGWFNNTQAAMMEAKPKDMSYGGFEKDVSYGMKQPTSNASIAASAMAGTTVTGLSAAAQQANAEAAAVAQSQLPKLSPLIIELSPNAIDRGVKSNDKEGGLLGRFMNYFG